MQRRDREPARYQDSSRSEGHFAGIDVEPVSGIEPLTCRLQGRFMIRCQLQLS
jgi:hypothetical protein